MAAFSGTWGVRLLNWRKAWKEWIGQVGLSCHLFGYIIRYTEDDPLLIGTLLAASDRIPIPNSFRNQSTNKYLKLNSIREVPCRHTDLLD